MNGTAVLNQNSSFVSNVPSQWSIKGTGDFNGDGKADILWQDTSGNVAIWEMNGTTVLNQNSSFVANVPSNWSIVGTGDFNGDGKADILWRKSNGDVGEWLSNSGAGYQGFTPVILQNVDPSWTIQGIGSFDGTANSDILWRNTNGDTGIWFANGAGGYRAVDLRVIDSSWSIQGVGDFNGDGKADILWRNANGTTGEWLSNAGSGFTGLTAVILATVPNSWAVAGGNPVLGASSAGVAKFAGAMASMGAVGGVATAASASLHTATPPVIAAPYPLVST
jgi:hypothetical protein